VSEQVRILRLAAGGDGVGRLGDGRTVFVPRTAPDDLVELGPLRDYARFARARVARVLEPGPGRVAPRCQHYLADDCGGCQLQHLGLPAQLEAKRTILEDSLRRIGRLEVAVPPVIPADDPWGYRSRILLSVGPGRRFAGFHRLGQPGRVFALERCEIAAPVLAELWTALRGRLHLLPEDVEQVGIRVDRAGRLHVMIEVRGERAWGGGRRLAEALAADGTPATIWWEPGRGAPRVVAGDRDASPATVFEQIYPRMGDRIRSWALDQLGTVDHAHVWDLYAGIGETTDQLRRRGATVESVERDPRAVELAERRGRIESGVAAESQRAPAGGVIRHVGRVEELVNRLRPPHAVIANPPRTGMAAVVNSALRESHPVRIVYVSCDPATLARDLGRLCSTSAAPPSRRAAEPPTRYRLIAVQPFDLFPQTAHLETVAVLEPE